MTKGEFLSILSIHKEKLKAEYEKPGWNIWVLYGALASLIWIIIDLYAKDVLEWKDSILILVAFVFIEPFASLLIKRLTGTNKKKTSAYRKINQEVRSGLPDILFSLTTYISIYIFCNFYSEYTFKNAKVLNAFIFLMIGIFLLMLVLSLFDFHFKKNASQSHGTAKITSWILLLAIAVLVVFGVRELLLEIQDFYSIKMIKSSLLFIGVYFVASRIVSYSQENLMLNSIDGLIDDVTLDNVSVDEGYKQLEIIIKGIEFSDIMAPSLQKYLELNKEFQKTIESTMHRLEKFSFDLPAEDQEMIKDSVLTSADRIQKIESEIGNVRDKFNRKIAYFYSYEHDSPEYVELNKQFIEMDKERVRQLGELQDKVKEIGDGS